MSCCMSSAIGTYIASKLLCSFLNMCNQYGLLSEDAQAAARLDGQQPLNQNTRRLQKVQRFKREREIKAKLGSMQMKQMRIAQLQDEVLCALQPCTFNGLMSGADHAVATTELCVLVMFLFFAVLQVSLR